MEIAEAYRKYRVQESHADCRGIEWKITFQEWLDWWGDDLDRRGPHKDELGMCRFHDKGPYQLGNIYKGHPRDNAKTNGNVQRGVRSSRAAKELHAQLLAADAVPSVPYDDVLSEDEYLIRRMTGAIYKTNRYTFVASR